VLSSLPRLYSLRACLKRCLDCDPPDYKMNHCNVAFYFTGGSEIRILLAQSVVLPESENRLPHDSLFGQDDEAFDSLGTLDNRPAHLPVVAQQPHRGLQEAGARVPSLHTAQPNRSMLQDTQEALGPITTLLTRGGHHHATSNPSVSTRIWRVRSLTCLVPSHLWSSPRSVVLAGCVSISTALG
jgi:hypothetical protein